MDVYLLRHAQAEASPPPDRTGDRWRELSAEGRDRARGIGRAMARMDPGLEIVLTSPAPRARATAEAVVAALRPRPVLEDLEALWIGGNPRAVAARLRKDSKALGAVLLVGHEPDLGHLVSLWLTGGPRLRLTFKKCGLCKLKLDHVASARCARLEWLLTPRQLMAIGGG
ncbi:MAG: histidine phosphatase family protein [Verrucomicrobiae bacterium]|nr:histidine phosphatase family protein [Verrucomicrobiae bacterium]